MKKFLPIVVVLVVGVAYLIGFWPQRKRRLELEQQVASLRIRLDEAEARGRICGLYTRAQGLIDFVAQKNYGQAQQAGTVFFDDVRAESSRTKPAFREPLESVLGMRDPVTVSLTKGDPESLSQLRRVADLLRGALETPTAAPPEAGARPADTPPGTS